MKVEIEGWDVEIEGSEGRFNARVPDLPHINVARAADLDELTAAMRERLDVFNKDRARYVDIIRKELDPARSMCRARREDFENRLERWETVVEAKIGLLLDEGGRLPPEDMSLDDAAADLDTALVNLRNRARVLTEHARSLLRVRRDSENGD